MEGNPYLDHSSFPSIPVELRAVLQFICLHKSCWKHIPREGPAPRCHELQLTREWVTFDDFCTIVWSIVMWYQVHSLLCCNSHHSQHGAGKNKEELGHWKSRAACNTPRMLSLSLCQVCRDSSQWPARSGFFMAKNGCLPISCLVMRSNRALHWFQWFEVLVQLVKTMHPMHPPKPSVHISLPAIQCSPGRFEPGRPCCGGGWSCLRGVCRPCRGREPGGDSAGADSQTHSEWLKLPPFVACKKRDCSRWATPVEQSFQHLSFFKLPDSAFKRRVGWQISQSPCRWSWHWLKTCHASFTSASLQAH